MNGSALEALTTIVRTLLVWWVVDRWAARRYRRDADGIPAHDDSAESEDGVTPNRSARRESQRNAPLLFAGRWLLGSLAILLSGTRVFFLTGAVLSSNERIPATLVLSLAVLVTAGILLMAELAESRLWTTINRIAGWLMAIVVSIGCASLNHRGTMAIIEPVVNFFLFHPAPWILLAAALLLTFPIGEWIGRFVSQWNEFTQPEQGLPGGGKWIGRLERLLILLCLVAGQPTGIAILVTAKGAFRFGEIRNDSDDNHQRKMIEYILIGSMLSYASALVVGWLVVFILNFLPLR